MNNTLTRVASILTLTFPLLAGPMTQADRDQLVEHYRQSRDGFLREVAGLSQAQLDFRPNAESWTVFECAEHIAVSEDNMREEFQEKFLPIEPEDGVESETPDEKILEYGTNRSVQRGQAPKSYTPIGRWTTLDALVAHFKGSRARNFKFVSTTPEDLRGRYFKDWKMDAYQYLLILSAHCQRHTKQIQEIKATDGFPK